MNTEVIKILLVDDHIMLRKGVGLLLSEEADITVVGETDNGEEAIIQVGSLKPDIVLIENSMPHLNGIEVTRQIISEFPHCKVIAFSTHSAKHYVDDMLSAGAVGYLLKESDPEELLEGIRAVMCGELFLSSTITSTVLEAYVEQISSEQPENKLKEDIGILQTKLHAPTIIPDLVSRTRLTDQLDAGKIKPLILISAPAGYGKSMLISSWLKNSEWLSAWVSLDQSESELRQFLLYCLATIENIFPHSCEQTLNMISAPQLPSITIIVNHLTNELEKIEQPFFLVLDDYHHIKAKSPVNELIYQLLERPPLSLHLVILTRRDPPMQLITLRAREQVTEIRMQELCFTHEETKSLLYKSAAFNANNNILDNLQREIEGWVVGLRLVSQILRCSNDPESFLNNLKGGVQQTNVYLLHEVFTRQAPLIQEYMLNSAILNRFCAPLCDALVQTDSNMLENSAEKFISELHDGNLFAIPLDLHGKWFRFHHLFQQLLQNELTKTKSPAEIVQLHERAGHWFETQGLIDEAIEHFLAAGDANGAAEIVEQRHWFSIERDKVGWRNHEKWFSMLPREIKEQRPNLLLLQAWAMHDRYQLAEIVPIIQQLEFMAGKKQLDKTCEAGLKLFQGMMCYWSGKGKLGLELLLEAKKLLPEKYPTMAGLIQIYISMTSHMAGQAKMALELSNEIIKVNGQQNKIFSSRLFISRAFLQALSGELMPAAQEGRRVNDILVHSDTFLMPGWGRYVQGSSYFRLNNLSAALEHFSPIINNKYNMHTRVTIDSMIGLALVYQAQQKTDAAINIMEKLLHFALEIGHSEHIITARSGQARLALAQGNLDLAIEWLTSFDGKNSAPSMFFWLEIPVITQARVLLAMGSPETVRKANKILASLHQEIEALHNTCQKIEVMTLQSLALQMTGNTEEALEVLRQVIILAEPGGWIRPFVELGQPMAKILECLEAQTGSSEYLSLLIEQCKPIIVQPLAITANQNKTLSANSSWKNETLTNREIDILELLIQRMQNKEMAAKLFVSAETIKTHLKHLYQKLGVNNRREAAVIAKEIISPQHRI